MPQHNTLLSLVYNVCRTMSVKLILYSTWQSNLKETGVNNGVEEAGSILWNGGK